MITNHNFLFDYIYYRITKAYFKWDGRTGATGIAAVTMIQVFIIIDLVVLLSRIFFERFVFAPYASQVGLLFVLLVVGLMIRNYKKYGGKYNLLKSYWKNEPKAIRRLKGAFVLVSIILPWIPLILVSVTP